MSESRKSHWEHIYASKQPADVSWYQPVPVKSLELIHRTGAALDAPIWDVGGGASTLVDKLLEIGYKSVTISVCAHTKSRITARQWEQPSSSCKAGGSWMLDRETSNDYRCTRSYLQQES